MTRRSAESALLPLLCWAAAWGFAACCQAPPPEVPELAGHGRLVVEDAWGRPAPRGANGAVYLTVVNRAAEPDKLLRARSADAAATELHQVTMTGGRMRMAPIADGLEIPGGGRLELAPAGHHLMVIDLARGLALGDHLAVVLEFEHGGEIAVRVPIVLEEPRADD